jgi:hypothetical protein
VVQVSCLHFFAKSCVAGTVTHDRYPSYGALDFLKFLKIGIFTYFSGHFCMFLKQSSGGNRKKMVDRFLILGKKGEGFPLIVSFLCV